VQRGSKNRRNDEEKFQLINHHAGRETLALCRVGGSIVANYLTFKVAGVVLASITSHFGSVAVVTRRAWLHTATFAS